MGNKIICKCKCENIEMGSYDRQISMLAPFEVTDCFGEGKRQVDGKTWLCVDICLAQEIAELWYLGIKTTGCCCGHNKVMGYIGVQDEYIDKMLELGYKTAPGVTLDRKDSFYPVSIT